MLSGTVVSIIQVYAFIAIAALCGTEMPPSGLLPLLPVLVLTGVTLSALGMFLSSRIRQPEHFAGVLTFLIFPLFFMSSALSPLWRVRAGRVLLAELCQYNPLTYVSELVHPQPSLDFNPTAPPQVGRPPL